tara:strand:- start:1405 stop:2328 length:924 start_codon:yes stop_codon:yes gene_type:complete
MTDSITPNFQDITPTTKTVPTMNGWYLSTTTPGVSEESVPWMLAQGWRPLSTQTDKTVFPNVVTYTMEQTTLLNQNVLHELLKDFTDAYNEGRSANDKRYEDVIELWSDMLDKSQTHLNEAETQLNNRVEVYLTTLDALEDEYDSFFAGVKTELNDLTVTLDARRNEVNDAFASRLSQASQDLVSRGLYSSTMKTSIDAGIEAEKQKALTEIAEAEQRTKADITLRKNQIYVDILRMRAGLIESKMSLTDSQQQFQRYHLSERNGILVGLMEFVERRNDGYPDMSALAQLTASLSESGAATWTSGEF